MIHSIDFVISFPHFLYSCWSIKYVTCVIWYRTLLIKENISLGNILTRKICKFNNWNYEIGEFMNNMKNFRKYWVFEELYSIKD